MKTKLLSALVPLMLALAGCASLDIGNADKTTTPAQAARSETPIRGRELAWGGVIVTAKNLSDKTEVEVIAYPLDRSNRPLTDEGPVGRFIAVQSGYLETADYAPGREVTVIGQGIETRKGKVGEASYIYPIIETKTLHLWPKEKRRSSEPTFTFGIGVGIVR